MKTLLFLLLLLPVLATAQAKADYTVSYSRQMATDGLKVQIKTKAAPGSDSTYFHYANEVWGENNLHRCLSGLEGENAQYRFRLVPDSNRVVVYHPHTKNISFSYRVKQDASAYSESVFNRPYVANTYFHVLGESLFMVPEAAIPSGVEDPDYVASITWVGFPAGYTLHNTFASGSTSQTLKVKLWTQFYRSLYVGGDYRIHKLPYQNRVVHVALRGQWQVYDEQRLLSTLQSAITSQRDFWRDAKFDYYTVVMTPTVTRTDSTFRGYSMKGASVHNGFILQSSNNPFNNWNMLRFMFNHEMMHTWVGGGGTISAAHEELNYWFAEGFTDYYAYKNRLRSGDLSFDEWLTVFNTEVIKTLYNNPERNQPNYLIKDNYWKSRKFEKLPYRRGALFAFWLDNQILRKSNYTKSLDDVMRELLKTCQLTQRKFTDEWFLAVVQPYVGQDLSYFFQKHILGGADLPLTTQELIDGFEVDSSQPVPVLKATQPSTAMRERYLNNRSLAQ
jgi:predicted metalloprotease with PDZ domain